jgi:hypothetical protein
MKKHLLRAYLIVCTAILFYSASAQISTNTTVLRQASVQQAEKERQVFQRLNTLAREKGWQMTMRQRNGGIAILVGVDASGLPLYLSTENNITAAATIGTNKLWPGGSLGLNLSGSSASVSGKLAIWDGGRVRATHVELTGRVTQKDAPGSTSDHSTHVAGTMIASGVNPLAKGMSFGQQELLAYDFGGHASEMLNESPNLLVSNHSYGTISGWYFNETDNRWEFRGRFGENEDYKFGYYSDEAQLWDSIAYNAPYYLIVKSAGNNRDINGPAVGQPYWRYNASGVMASAGNRPAGISSNDGYDIIATYGTSKNILTVGAVFPISGGYNTTADVELAPFSSWGPTDDGRIKPDVVADGIDLLSSIATSDNAYDIYSGTSMATPSASGSLLLLQEYYASLHSGNFMRAATLKGLVIHTADEAGPSAGPDYQHGWGLINMQKAAAVITANNTTHLINETVINNGGTFTIPVIASGNGTISATLSWTDPKGQFISSGSPSALDNPAKKLVNDMDIVITRNATTYRPWVLSPTVPAAAATRGDNTLDNVEKIELTDIIPGQAYTITVSHKGVLERGSQAVSVIVSGVGGTAYCSSGPTSSAGARIDSVSFSNIQNKNSAGCTTYSNFTNLTGNLQPGQTVPFFVRLNSCDASTAAKIVKVFIDANNDGDFADPNELLATSVVLNGNTDFTTNLTVPAGLNVGEYTILRVVMQETSNAASVTPCGSYAQGETQDYRILMTTPSTDVGISELVSPLPGNCSAGEQYAVVRIQNFGSTPKSNVPVTVEVKQGATVVATLTGTFPRNIPAGESVVYVMQTPFVTQANTAYTFTSKTTLAGDQLGSNDQLVSSITTSATTTDPTGTAVICGNQAVLKATPVTGSVFTWYNSNTSTTPIASGTNTTTSSLLPTYYLAKNDNNIDIGPATKSTYGAGGYNLYQNNFMMFNTGVPLTIETVRLYIGNANTTGKLNFIVGRDFSFNNQTNSFTYQPEAVGTLDIFTTAPAPNDPSDPGAIFYMNIPVTTPGDHIILISNPDDNDLSSVFRNNAVPGNPYPIGVPGLFTWTGNSASYGPTPANFQTFYYFFYDMKLKFDQCASNRVAVTPTTATAPTISISGNVITSSSATGNQWYRDGVIIAGETGQTLTATIAGSYTTRVTDAGGCTLESNAISFTPTAVPNVDPQQIGLTISPVPARGSFDVKLEVRTKSDLSISLINTAGQRVYQSTTPDFIGKLNKTINPGKIAAGVYYLQIMHDKKMYVRKIVIVE